MFLSLLVFIFCYLFSVLNIIDIMYIFCIYYKQMENMETRLQKQGNSLGIRIPKGILKCLNIKTNDVLTIEQEEDKIIISVPKKKKISLEERFNNYHGDNLAKDFSWDEPIGENYGKKLYSQARRRCIL